MQTALKKRYEPKPWSNIKKKDAKPIYDYALETARELGLESFDERSATEALRLKIDRDLTSPFRKYMTWDVEKGMAKLHRHEIRNIIGQIEVVTITLNGIEERMRALTNIEFEVQDFDKVPVLRNTFVDPPVLVEHKEFLDQVVTKIHDRMRYWAEEAKRYDVHGVLGKAVRAIEENDSDINGWFEKFIADAKEALLAANTETRKNTVALKAGILLLLAPVVGTDVRQLMRRTGYKPGLVKRIRSRLLKAKIWSKRAPCKGHAWKIKQVVLDGFWEDVYTAIGLK